MQTKGRIMLMVIAGGYLAYLGGGLVSDAMKERPENYILYTVVGVLFLVIGAACCLFNLKKYIKHEYRDPFKDAIEEEEAEEDAQASEMDAEVSESEAQAIEEKPSDEAKALEESPVAQMEETEDGINSCKDEQTIEQENSGKEE